MRTVLYTQPVTAAAGGPPQRALARRCTRCTAILESTLCIRCGSASDRGPCGALAFPLVGRRLHTHRDAPAAPALLGTYGCIPVGAPGESRATGVGTRAGSQRALSGAAGQPHVCALVSCGSLAPASSRGVSLRIPCSAGGGTPCSAADPESRGKCSPRRRGGRPGNAYSGVGPFVKHRRWGRFACC